MQKIPTLFIRDPENMSRVTREITPGCEWVMEGSGIPTRKRDGTNILVKKSLIYQTNVVPDGQFAIDVQKRRNPTREEKAQGVEPGYVPCPRDDPSNQHIYAAVDAMDFSIWPDGIWSCEALGAKIQGGVEGAEPRLYPFSWWPEVIPDGERSFEGIKAFLKENVMEGIVYFDLKNSRMAKIKSKDFGLPWLVR